MTATQLLRPRAEREARHFAGADRKPVANKVRASRSSIEPVVVVHCAGQDFVVKKSMAEIFFRNARQILSNGGSELTPLLHAGGIDLLLITPTTAKACLIDGSALDYAHRVLGPATA